VNSPLAGAGLWSWYLPGTMATQALGSLPVRHRAQRYYTQAVVPESIEAQDYDWLDRLKAQGLSHVLVKAGDGPYRWGQYNAALVEACHDRELRCVPWVYAYGDNPGAEAQVAIGVAQVGGDGLVLDVEYEYVGQFASARQYVDLLRRNLPDTFIGYAPDFRIAFANRWPAGGWQPQNEPWPWETFNELDAVIPQLYWTDFAQPWMRTMDLCHSWAVGCEREGWPVPPIYPLLPANGTANDCGAAAEWAVAAGMRGVSLWRQGTESRGVLAAVGAVAWPEEDDLSAEERAELDYWLANKAYFQTLLGSDDNPGGQLAQAIGTMETAAADDSQDRETLAATVLGQCSGLRKAAGLSPDV
jgi:hypothetical protein